MHIITMTTRVCVECAKERSPYRCPKCREFYCSAACCKAHAQKHDDDNVAGALMKDSVDHSNTETAANTATDAEVDSLLLTEDQKQRLLKSDLLRQRLRSKRLRDALTEIDTADHHRLNVLHRKRLHPDFEAFLNDVLQCIGAQ